MDLSKVFPRSPKQKMAGLVHLGRMIDKGRAYKEKKLADYIYPCPLDKIILNFLCIEADTFANITVEKKDEEISNWVKELIKSKSPNELDLINKIILEFLKKRNFIRIRISNIFLHICIYYSRIN